LGLPPGQERQAAALYWQAFGGKLNRVMGPKASALAFLTRVIRSDHVIVALDARGTVIGLAGFKTSRGAFAGGSTADMRAVYGACGATWRAAILWLLQREVDNRHFLLDGICVDRAARNTGIGTALLAAICAEARRRGYPGVRLDVIDTNWRARALYERNGFVTTGTQSLGMLRHIFGFSAATTMVHTLG
jgi:ribosomal protein S18 acetylase RimI-like enzyme